VRKSLILLVFASLVGTLALPEYTEAGIFGRRRERIKAEVRAELYPQLAAKVDGDVARGMETATNSINAATSEKFAAEAAKLQGQVDAEVVKLREQTAAQVAAEAKKLQDQAATALKDLTSSAENVVAAQAKKLEESSAAQLEILTAKLEAKFAEEAKKLELAHAEQLKKLLTANDEQLKTFTANAKTDAEKYAQAQAEQIKADLLKELQESVQVQVKAAQATQPVAPVENEESKPQETIAPAPPAVEVRDEKPADSDDQE
jgi:hypothetical protein